MQPLSDIFFCLVSYNYCGTKILKNKISNFFITINVEIINIIQYRFD